MFKKIITLSVVLISLYAFFAYIPKVLNTASAGFPLATDITVDEGMTHRDITELLEEKRVVRSGLYLYFVLTKMFENDFVQAGTYRFDAPLTTYEVAQVMTRGTNTTPLLKVTFPEGFRAEETHLYVPETFSNADYSTIKASEGYLFPDTYFISKDTDLTDLITIMRTTFDEKIKTLSTEIAASGLTESDLVILASIIEREAKDLTSKKMVSGILQNRLKLGMPLQVDAAFAYVLGKTSAELTADDLATDSPYNTYTRMGLPPTPISNPGMDSLRAVLAPIETDYLYYLTGDDGEFYYAKTFEQHKENKNKYLR